MCMYIILGLHQTYLKMLLYLLSKLIRNSWLIIFLIVT
nr:MAG TPA: hypothetical protein [Caudoviricetes sp.]